MKFRLRVALLAVVGAVLVCIASLRSGGTSQNDDFLMLTVATKETGFFRRFYRSAKVNELPLKILGMGTKWGGFGHKLLLMTEELARHKDFPERIIMFVDAYDIILNADSQEILRKFKKFDARVVFSAESNCWPNSSLASAYPPVGEGKQFLNSGMFIGYAPELFRMITDTAVTNDDDDQLFFTKIYLDERKRREFNFKLDHRSEIFQNMEGGVNNMELRFEAGREAYLVNKDYDTRPLVIHTPGYCKYLFYILGNYIPKIWHPDGGCAACLEDVTDLSKTEPENYPTVLIAVFIEEAPALDEFLHKLHGLNYSKERISLLVHNEGNYETELVERFISNYTREYNSIRLVANQDIPQNTSMKDMAIEECVKIKCDFYFNLESIAHLDNADTLRLLVEQNRPVVGPMLFGREKGQRNFRGLDAYSDYCRNSVTVHKDNDRGLWTVGVISTCYLVRGDVIHNPETKPIYGVQEVNDPDVIFSELMDTNDVEIFASNRFDFGRLVM